MNIFFEYAVKFVCGKQDGNILAPGSYWTAINVHNPSADSVVFRFKAALTAPNLEQGPISKFHRAKLGPDGALEIDCDDVRRLFDMEKGFAKGFIVIQSPSELDVVAVYTASGSDKRVETFHTERVPARQIRQQLADLVPVPDDSGQFCRREESTLIVTVMNQGGSQAGPSTTRVDFGQFGIVDTPTPSLMPGAQVDLNVPIPMGCFNPDCDFRITVDVHNVVAESNEGNNTASGMCLG